MDSIRAFLPGLISIVHSHSSPCTLMYCTSSGLPKPAVAVDSSTFVRWRLWDRNSRFRLSHNLQYVAADTANFVLEKGPALCPDYLFGKFNVNSSSKQLLRDLYLFTKVKGELFALTQPAMVAAKKQTLKNVTDYIADVICKRAELGYNYGVVLIPEGLVDFIPEKNELHP